jgi:hypothetical protein
MIEASRKHGDRLYHLIETLKTQSPFDHLDRPNVQVRFRVGEYSASHDGAMVPRGILNLMET